MNKQNNKRKIATTGVALLGVSLIFTGAFAALSDTLTHDETVVIEWVDIVDGSSTNLALEDVSDVTNTPVEELTPGITYELTGVLENDSTVITNWTATDLSATPGMSVNIADSDGVDDPVNAGEDVDVAQFGITVSVDQSVTPSAPLNFAIEFSSTDARMMLTQPTAISTVFPDPALATCIASNPESGANGDVNYQISQNELNNIEDLTCASMGITSIEGVQYLTNLKTANLNYNEISDLSPLAYTTNLVELRIYTNNITDITPLANLVNLEVVYLSNNEITDLTPLSNLTNLVYLDLNSNNISDLSPIAGLVNLTYLNLGNNLITDVTPLANMQNLDHLLLWGNDISDISPIAGITSLDRMFLYGNQITDYSSLTYQPATFDAAPQDEVVLPDTTLGTPTPITIDGVNGEDLIITFNTPGTYNNGELTWTNPGVNSLSYASADGTISGTITQQVN